MSIAERAVRKLVRIIEGPPVRERTVVRVVDGAEAREMRPGFLVGVYRSGTTLLRYILDSHPHIAVPPETNFMETLAELWTSEWNRKGLAGVGVDEKALQWRLRRFAGGILDDYALAKGKRRWFDKTPCYVGILEVLQGVFGEETQYILVYRHGLDVADSIATVHAADGLGGPVKRYLEAYGETPRLAALRHWVEQCERMLTFHEARPAQCFSIRYEDYARDPRAALPPLFEFIGERWCEAVLNFSAQSHDFGLQDHKILERRGFQPSTGNYTAWSADELRRAQAIAGDTLEKLGYRI